MDRRLLVAFFGFMLFMPFLLIIPGAGATAYTPSIDSSQYVTNPNNALVDDGAFANFYSSTSNSWMIFDLGSSYGNISCIEMKFYSSTTDGRLTVYVSRDKATWIEIVHRFYAGLNVYEQAFKLSYELRDIRYVKVAPYNYFYLDYIRFCDYPYVFNAGGHVYAQYFSSFHNDHNSRFGSLGVGISRHASSLYEWFDLGQYDWIVYDYGRIVIPTAFNITLGSGGGAAPTVQVGNSSTGPWITAGVISTTLNYTGVFRYVNLTVVATGAWLVHEFNAIGGYNLTGSLLSSIILNSPSNGTTLYTKAVNFAFTPEWTVSNYSIVSAKLYVDGIVQGIMWYPTLLNGTQNTISYTFPSYGTYSWYVRLYNSTAYIQSTPRALTLELGYYLTIGSSPLGSTSPVAGTYAYAVGATQAITATPANSSWRWSYWLINALKKNVYNPITAVMDKNYTYAPVFASTATSNVTASMMSYLPYLLFIAGAGIAIVLVRGKRNG